MSELTRSTASGHAGARRPAAPSSPTAAAGTRPLLGAAVALLATAGAVLLRAAITPLLGQRIPFLAFFPAVVVSAWYGGLWAGLLCTALSTGLTVSLFLEPSVGMVVSTPGDVVATVIFAATGVLVALLNESLRRQRAIAQRAQREADVANRAKDEFLANLSHELRTPLTSILGWTRLLRVRASDPAAVDRALATIERNAMAQAHIIDDLFDVSRIVGGELRLELRPIDPAEVVRHAVDAQRPTAEAKGVALESALDGGASIEADPGRLQQIVDNLLSNAIKFTPRGGRIEVRLERRPAQVVLRVADTGLGIAPEFLPHAFERFRQADSSTTRAHAGLGLGLSIVQRLVALHGGSVTAASEGLGKGAVFTVVLPARSPPVG